MPGIRNLLMLILSIPRVGVITPCCACAARGQVVALGLILSIPCVGIVNSASAVGKGYPNQLCLFVCYPLPILPPSSSLSSSLPPLNFYAPPPPPPPPQAAIGIAFSLGFLFGPSIGAAFSIWGRSSGDSSYAMFQYPALFSLLMALLNIIIMLVFFKDTLPVEKRVRID